MVSKPEESLSLNDLFYYLAKKKRFICVSIAIGTLLFLTNILIKPVLYKAEATFVDRGKSANGIESSSLNLFLQGGNENGGQVLSLLQSERLLEKIVVSLGLQAGISPAPTLPLFLRPFYQLEIAWAHFKNIKTPLFSAPPTPFRLKTLSYEGENFFSFDIFLLKEGKFFIETASLGRVDGLDGELFSLPEVSFTLERDRSIEEGFYHVDLHPKKPLISDLKKSLLIEPSKKISQLILLDCIQTDRQQAALILNSLMAEAEKELQAVEKEGALKQVAILEERQVKSFEKLEDLLKVHATNLSEDFHRIGFIDSEKALSFYAQAQDLIEKDLLKLDFEKKRYEEALKLIDVDVERLSSITDIPSLIPSIEKLRTLKTKRDSLSLALLHQEPEERAFITLSPWERVEVEHQEIKNQLALLESTGKIMESSLPQLRPWVTLLKTSDEDAFSCSKREGCKKTLQHLLRLYEIEGSILTKAPFDLSEAPSTYEGLSSELSFELLLSYQKHVDEVEEKGRQLSHLLVELEEESLPLSAIAMSFPDESGKELGEKVKLLEVGLQDPKNRSQKEQDRIRDELVLERLFLKSHFKGLLDLLALKGDLFKKKIGELRRVTLSGLHQELSLLENEILLGLQERLQRMEEERELLYGEKESLQAKMAPLPFQWADETLLKQKLHLHEVLFGEVTRLSENKEISSQLNLILSAPLDKAYPPVLPMDPRLLFYTVLGSFSGFFFALSFLLFKMSRKGLPATPHSLKTHEQKSLEMRSIKEATSLEELTDTELDGLRDLLKAIQGSNLFIGTSPALPSLLSLLYLKREDKKALLIDLEGTLLAQNHPVLSQENGFDRLLLPQGRFLSDYLHSNSFKKVLKELKEKYSLILATTHKREDSLVSLFDQTFIHIEDESLDDLESLFPKHPIFLFFQS